MMRHFFLAWLILFSGRADAQTKLTAEIVEYGIYTADATSSEREANGLLSTQLTNVRLAVKTTTVPAQLGVHFGIRIRVNGGPIGERVTLRKITLFPPPGLRSPAVSQPLKSSERFLSVPIGETHYTSYGFDDPWELVPGRWEVQIWSGDRKLASQVFNVVAP
jgi:Domain of unknown function (DUF3859)